MVWKPSSDTQLRALMLATVLVVLIAVVDLGLLLLPATPRSAAADSRTCVEIRGGPDRAAVYAHHWPDRESGTPGSSRRLWLRG